MAEFCDKKGRAGLPFTEIIAFHEEEDTYDDTRPADEDIPDNEGEVLFSIEIARIEETFPNG